MFNQSEIFGLWEQYLRKYFDDILSVVPRQVKFINRKVTPDLFALIQT
jgi:hypothetical protein